MEKAHMEKTRREFLAETSLGLVGVAAGVSGAAAGYPEQSAGTARQEEKSASTTPGTPPAFGTSPAVGPEVSSDTFEQAEKLVQVEMIAGERTEAAEERLARKFAWIIAGGSCGGELGL
jgi:hypothetical protein